MGLFRSDTGMARAEVPFQGCRGAGRIHQKHDRVACDEDPEVAVLAIRGQGLHPRGYRQAKQVLPVKQPGRECRAVPALGTEPGAGPASAPDATHGSWAL